MAVACVRPVPVRFRKVGRGETKPTVVKVEAEEVERAVGELKGPEAGCASKLFRPSAPEGGETIWGGAPGPAASSLFLSSFDPLW